MKIIIAVPCYHCSEQIRRVILSLSQVNKIADIIIIENSGDDQTLDVAIEAAQKNPSGGPDIKIFRNQQNYGLGGSFKIAVNYARNENYDFLIWLHGDDQAEVKDLLEMINIEDVEQYDVVFGARFMKGSSLYDYDRLRSLANLAFNLLASALLRHRIYDIGSGLNMYKVASLPEQKILEKWVNNIAFDINLLRHFIRRRYVFFPISWRQIDQKSTVSNFRVGFQVLRILLFPFFGLSINEEPAGETRMVFP